jgi:hypothetical protein
MAQEDEGQQELDLASEESHESEAAEESAAKPTTTDPIIEKLTALEARLEQEREARIRAEATSKATADALMTAQHQQPAARDRVTLADLQKKVDAGELEPLEALKILSDQDKEEMRAEISKTATAAALAAEARAEMKEWERGRPELRDPASPEYQRVQARFGQLHATYGEPADDTARLRMILDACEREFGSPSKPRETTRETRETHINRRRAKLEERPAVLVQQRAEGLVQRADQGRHVQGLDGSRSAPGGRDHPRR